MTEEARKSEDEVPSRDQVAADLEQLDLTEAQKGVLEKVKAVHDDVKKKQGEFVKELLALRDKYDKMYQPLFDKRKGLLIQKAEEDEEEPKGTPGLPSFWLKALSNHRMLAQMIEERDEPVLEYLQDIASEWKDPEEQSTFTLTFQFADNPFFTPNVLEKTYFLEREDESDDDEILAGFEATVIEWKEGKDPTKKKVHKKQRNKRTKEVRIIESVEKAESFFNFFHTKKGPTDSELSSMSADACEQLEMMMDFDFQAGCTIRDKIIPKAVLWFLGEAVDSDDEEDDDDDDHDLDDDSDDDDDDSDDDDHPPPKHGHGNRGRGGRHGGGRGGGDTEQCKQQ